MRPYAEPDQRLAAHVEQTWESHADSSMPPREILIYARTDFNLALQGTDPTQLDVPLQTAMLRFDQFDEAEGNPGYSEAHVTRRALQASTAANIALRVSQATDEQLAGVRSWLRTWWERIYTLRNAGGIPDELRAWALEIDTTHDPRESGYDPRKLLIVTGATLASLHEFQPEFLR